jgi:predicted RNA-binding Zn-ribbon protein involved in translation (DUF1610 family)
MKILGCKVSNEIYEQFKSLGPISDSLRKAITQFLEYQQNQRTTEVNPSVKRVNQTNKDHTYNNESNHQQQFSRLHKTKEKQILNNQDPSKNYNIDLKNVNSKKILISKPVNPPPTFQCISRVNRLLELRQKNKKQKLIKNIKTNGTTSSKFTLFRCPNCGQMINIQSRRREGEITICPNCKQGIYL